MWPFKKKEVMPDKVLDEVPEDFCNDWYYEDIDLYQSEIDEYNKNPENEPFHYDKWAKEHYNATEPKEVCCKDCIHFDGFCYCLLHVLSEAERNVITGETKPTTYWTCNSKHLPGNGMTCGDFSPNKDCIKDEVV